MPHERRALSVQPKPSNSISPPMIRPPEISKKLSNVAAAPGILRRSSGFRSDQIEAFGLRFLRERVQSRPRLCRLPSFALHFAERQPRFKLDRYKSRRVRLLLHGREPLIASSFFPDVASIRACAIAVINFKFRSFACCAKLVACSICAFQQRDSLRRIALSFDPRT